MARWPSLLPNASFTSHLLDLPPMLLGLFIEFVYARITEDVILPFKVVPLTRADLNEEPDRVSISERLYESHITGLSQGYFGTSELLVH
jgi:hypothetical protein